jgi:salicylate hydroxylase
MSCQQAIPMLDPMTTQPLSVAIVGGGIAGLTLAKGLLKSKLHPKIFERDVSLREIGAGIGFTPNAERAMKVLDPRIHEAFKRVTVQNGTDWFMCT